MVYATKELVLRATSALKQRLLDNPAYAVIRRNYDNENKRKLALLKATVGACSREASLIHSFTLFSFVVCVNFLQSLHVDRVSPPSTRLCILIALLHFPFLVPLGSVSLENWILREPNSLSFYRFILSSDSPLPFCENLDAQLKVELKNHKFSKTLEDLSIFVTSCRFQNFWNRISEL